MIGKNLLHFRIIKKLGVGGQGEVYLAVNTKLDRAVVIKVLPTNLTANDVNLKRFQREARLASALDHPNICAVYDLAYADGLHFIVMQHVEGSNVRELVKGHPLELKSALSIAIQVCEALIAAHTRGIIHRDIKANNVMVSPSGQVKVLDFGLAKLLDDREIPGSDGIHRTEITEVGVPYGTATYAAPEQAQGLRVDERADIFSTGVLLYEMLTGKWPFQGKTVIDVRYSVLHDTPAQLSEARPTPVPPRLQQIVDRAIAKEPSERYKSAKGLRDELADVLHDISVDEDPTFREAHVAIPPRRVAKSGSRFFPIQRIAALTGLREQSLKIIGLALVSFLLVPLLFWISSRYRSSRAANGEGVVLRLHGSNTIGATLAPVLAVEFLKNQGASETRIINSAVPDEATVVGTLPGNSSETVIEIRSHGSSTAFTDLLAGEADIGLSSRKIKTDEIARLAPLGEMSSPTSEHVLALDGIALIVNRNNSIDSLTKEQLAQVFAGEITNWEKVGGPAVPIKIYARDDKSGTFDSFKTLVLGNRQLTTAAERFEDSNLLSEAVSRDPNGIGFIGFAYVKDAKAIAVSDENTRPLVPNRLTVATEDYTLSRRLFLYTPANAKNLWIRRFVDFALSAGGQEIVEKNGFVAQTVKAESSNVALNAPEEYRRLTTGAERLSLNFRFHKGGKELDSKARIDLDRVIEFISDLKYTGQNILLLGFATDANGGPANIELSKKRAELVAQQFKLRGITPAVVTGFGSEILVAQSSTEEGKERNSRVELWLKR